MKPNSEKGTGVGEGLREGAVTGKLAAETRN